MNNNTPIYGLSYEPLGNLQDVGDLSITDVLFPPLAVGKYLGEKIGGKVNQYVDKQAARAGAVAAQRVEAGVNRAVSNTAKGVGTFLAGGLVIGAIAGGIYFYRKSKDRR